MALLSFFNLANEKLEVADKWLRDKVENLATVATTGSYNDLSDTPNIGNSDISGIGDGTITGSIDTINSNLSGLLLFRIVTFDALTLNANASGSVSKAYPVIDGYTPQGIVTVSLSTTNATIVEYTISASQNVNLTLRNNTSSSLTVTGSVKLMYVKNLS